MSKLTVYISNDCWGCTQARQIVAEMQTQFPQIEMTLLDNDSEQWPQEVFAVPTYMLNGRVISLGNPTTQQLHTRLSAAIH